MPKLTLRAIRCCEDIARTEPPGRTDGPLEVWSAWAKERAPAVTPAIGEDGFVEVPEDVADALLAIVEAHLDRTDPPANKALLPRAVAALLRSERPKRSA